MVNPLPLIVFILLAVAGVFAVHPGAANPASAGLYFLWLLASLIIASAFRVAAQWEKALIFRLGRFQAVKGPGMFTVLPLVDQVRIVDTRILTLEIPRQEAITKDNVPVTLDGVIFLRVNEPKDAIMQVQNYQHAIRQYAQTALRDVVGAATLDEILADREALGKRIEEMVESEVIGWGLEVAAIRIQDILLPEDLKRVMARQASAEREKRANITKSEGDRLAAENLAAAASTMAASPGALQLRSLQTLDSLGNSPSNTVVLAVPVEVMTALQAIPKLVNQSAVVENKPKEIEKAPPAPLAEGFFRSQPKVDAEETDLEDRA
ncbi:SPFH domain-containing protein [Fimbriimonas ginsengisoli]|uniref:Putative stomatin/prohibitin-family membrane protease subunit n=1 Tax=Fimbriimonas ginsengisoli Gsoil 348 TaxID=661478 RepID=A0A068NL12_FIMGI|nr:SPFH domain-containing protein [Fimbriimonas ginsengisoli]AIE84161.1 Putative stomatin/prohibitin-family membrane protease subunit [Fimbriimonas ginsengisoli Gsoil 348]